MECFPVIFAHLTGQWSAVAASFATSRPVSLIIDAAQNHCSGTDSEPQQYQNEGSGDNLMMGCACLGLSRGRPISLHSPFFRCVGAGHVTAGRRSCCLFHIFHRRTHIGLAAIAIHHTHHPFLKITGHYPGDAILRGRKTRVTFSKALVAANPFREECVAPCSRDRALSASHVRFNRCP